MITIINVNELSGRKRGRIEEGVYVMFCVAGIGPM